LLGKGGLFNPSGLIGPGQIQLAGILGPTTFAR
jgi:hypothetical protein